MTTKTDLDDEVIESAKRILLRRMRKSGIAIESPQALRDFLTLSLAEHWDERFVAVYLDARHRVIGHEVLFYGSLTGAAIYVGVVARKCLLNNAAALIVAHNHPSGVAEPSSADRELTERLRQALVLIEVRLLDHVVVGGPHTVSFAERGWL